MSLHGTVFGKYLPGKEHTGSCKKKGMELIIQDQLVHLF